MEAKLYAPNFLVVWDGVVTKFGEIQGWVEMGEIEYADIRPATYSEIIHYTEVQKRKS